jgi:8-oxo-dGTP diphosphatase
MNRKIPVELTNMCMIYDGQGNVLVEEKLVYNPKGLIFPGGHVESNEFHLHKKEETNGKS